ncbi:hypothetical protein ACU21_04245 [Actinobaculum suis]|nr:hypothetical protein ACU20_06020 [Actinobaculum suis]OCA95363.1 hypothetical protein ACU21_04245 [Actinobaculum suis]
MAIRQAPAAAAPTRPGFIFMLPPSALISYSRRGLALRFRAAVPRYGSALRFRATVPRYGSALRFRAAVPLRGFLLFAPQSLAPQFLVRLSCASRASLVRPTFQIHRFRFRPAASDLAPPLPI